MFDLSKKTDYGMELMVFLARNYDKGVVSLKEASEAKKLPFKFLEQIASDLKDSCLIESKEGKGGGYRLAREPKEINVGEIMMALEGPVLGGCAGCPNAAGCGHQEVWEEVGDKVRDTMAGKSLADLIK
jgi:Rrf2 family protein